LYLSAFFEANRFDYYRHLWAASARGAITEWVKFFLRGVAEQSLDASQKVISLQKLHERWIGLVTQKRKSGLNIRLIDSLFERPVLTIPQAAALLDVSYQSAKTHVQGLVDDGILKAIDVGQNYNKMFYAHEILSALER
jgi:Fic family protein